MRPLDLVLIPGPRMRFYQASRKSCGTAPHWRTLHLERLENRVVPATVTFAQFSQLGGSPQSFDYTNDNGTSADFATVPGGDSILLSFDTQFAPV